MFGPSRNAIRKIQSAGVIRKATSRVLGSEEEVEPQGEDTVQEGRMGVLTRLLNYWY